MALGSIPVAVTSPSDFVPASSKEFLDIQATIECGFTLKRVCDMTRTYSLSLVLCLLIIFLSNTYLEKKAEFGDSFYVLSKHFAFSMAMNSVINTLGLMSLIILRAVK